MDEADLKLVKDWLTRAHQDLRASTILATAQNPPLDVAIYHCQQTAEKALKAFFQWHDVPFAKTHNLRALVLQASVLEKGFSDFAEAADLLTPYVSAFRYPGGADESMPTSEEFLEALKQAQTIFNFVVKLVPNEARPTTDDPNLL